MRNEREKAMQHREKNNPHLTTRELNKKQAKSKHDTMSEDREKKQQTHPISLNFFEIFNK